MLIRCGSMQKRGEDIVPGIEYMHMAKDLAEVK
jgi:hypothetical protein